MKRILNRAAMGDLGDLLSRHDATKGLNRQGFQQSIKRSYSQGLIRQMIVVIPYKFVRRMHFGMTLNFEDTL